MKVYVPNATMTNTAAMMIAVADENSFTVGVGVGLVVGSVTVLLVGMNNACTAADSETVYESGLVVETVPPFAPTINQHSNLKSVPAVAVKV